MAIINLTLVIREGLRNYKEEPPAASQVLSHGASVFTSLSIELYGCFAGCFASCFAGCFCWLFLLFVLLVVLLVVAAGGFAGVVFSSCC